MVGNNRRHDPVSSQSKKRRAAHATLVDRAYNAWVGQHRIRVLSNALVLSGMDFPLRIPKPLPSLVAQRERERGVGGWMDEWIDKIQ